MATAIEPVRQAVEVELELGEAFELFTTGIAEWWPYKTHFSRRTGRDPDLWAAARRRAEGGLFRRGHRHLRPGSAVGSPSLPFSGQYFRKERSDLISK
jgi:hypothetical protein